MQAIYIYIKELESLEDKYKFYIFPSIEWVLEVIYKILNWKLSAIEGHPNLGHYKWYHKIVLSSLWKIINAKTPMGSESNKKGRKETIHQNAQPNK